MILTDIAPTIGALQKRVTDLEKEVASLKESTIKLASKIGNDVGFVHERVDAIVRAREDDPLFLIKKAYKESEPAPSPAKTSTISKPTGNELVGRFFKDKVGKARQIVKFTPSSAFPYKTDGEMGYAYFMESEIIEILPFHPCAGWIHSWNRKLEFPIDPYAEQRELLGKWVIYNGVKTQIVGVYTTGLVTLKYNYLVIGADEITIDPNQNP